MKIFLLSCVLPPLPETPSLQPRERKKKEKTTAATPLSFLSLSPARRLDLPVRWPPPAVLGAPWPPLALLPTRPAIRCSKGMLWMHGVIAAPSLLAVSLLRRRRRPLEREAMGAGCGSHDFLSGGSGHSEWRASASAEAHQWCRRRPFFRSGEFHRERASSPTLSFFTLSLSLFNPDPN